MIKRLINWFKDYKYRNLIYHIEGDYVIITNIKDFSSTSIRLPKAINGCEVLDIDTHLKTFGPLEYINGEKVRNDMHLINNRFIYKGNRIYRIVYQIGNDYYVSYYLRYFHESIYSYIINNHEYDDRIIYYRF